MVLCTGMVDSSLLAVSDDLTDGFVHLSLRLTHAEVIIDHDERVATTPMKHRQ